MDATGPNAEQITYWNEKSGPKWVTEQARLDRMIAPFGAEAMSALAPKAGEQIIDVGCGCGETSLQLGRHVTASGGVHGVDISKPMLARARERAEAAGHTHVRFTPADAQTHAFPCESADAIFSRFGVMFFADPVAAFGNLRQALRSNGRIAFVCWQPMPVNPWMAVPLMAAAGVAPMKPPPPPGTPGPFALGDRTRLESLLSEAGFRDIVLAPFTPTLVVGGGGDLDATVEFVLQLGALSAILEESPDAVARVRTAVRQGLAPYATEDGIVMESAAWVVTARR
jgi:SAM-dependent methyltransferase